MKTVPFNVCNYIMALYLKFFLGGGDVFNGLNVHWHKLTLTALRGYLGLYCLITNRLSILRIFFSFDYKYRGIITGRYTSCVASRGAAGVFCHHWPLTAGVSRVARAPALIPLCARLRTAVPETERLNFAKRALRARAVLRGRGGCHISPSLANETQSRG